MMVKLLHLLLMMHLLSCASGPRRPESFAQKMRRYQAKTSSHHIPTLTVDARQFQQRLPASDSARPSLKKTSALNPAKNGKGLEKNIHFSNKRLYFLSLLEQHGKFENYLPGRVSPAIGSCPGLHSAFLDYKRSYTPTGKKLRAEVQPTGALLALPVGHGKQDKTLADIEEKGERKQLFNKALSVHVEKIHSELVELCQYGTSDNYYAYENLMTHIKRDSRGFPVSSQNLQSLVKTTIFSNKILLSALEKQVAPKNLRAPASAAPKSQSWLHKVMQKHHLEWFEQYAHTIK